MLVRYRFRACHIKQNSIPTQKDCKPWCLLLRSCPSRITSLECQTTSQFALQPLLQRIAKLALDWRIQAVAITASDAQAAYPSGPLHPAGSALVLTSLVQSAEGVRYAFLTSSAAALALSVATKAVRAASRIKNDLRFSSIVSPGQDPHLFVSPPSLLFDYFEHCFVALLFSIQALEAYCNYKIAYTLNEDFTIQRNGKPVTLSPIDVESCLSIDEKLGEVLPRLLNIPSPKGRTVWEKYVRIRRLRAATVHIKSHHQWTSSLERFQESPYAWCLQQSPSAIPIPAIEMISHFAVDNEREWLDSAQMLMNTQEDTSS